MRMRRLLWTGLGVAAAGAAGAAWGEAQWRSASNRLTAELLSPARSDPRTVDFARDLNTLPRIVARYFRASVRDGQPMIARAHVSWRGEFNMGTPGQDRWRAFTAEQDFNPAAPGFVWNARIRFAPGMPVLVRDGFVSHQGAMRGALLGLIPVVNAQPSPDLSSGALQRYLGECAWLPTALLPGQGVTWTALDDARATASIAAGSTRVSLEFRFNADALPVSIFAAARMMDDGAGRMVPRPWEARILSFTRQDGMTIPARATAVWHLPGGDFEYWRGAAERVSYDFVR
jgi:hypothetical protein